MFLLTSSPQFLVVFSFLWSMVAASPSVSTDRSRLKKNEYLIRYAVRYADLTCSHSEINFFFMKMFPRNPYWVDKRIFLYCKTPKNLDTRKNCCNHPKIWTKWFYCRIMRPKSADWMANSVDPDRTAPQSDLGLHCLFRPVCPKI